MKNDGTHHQIPNDVSLDRFRQHESVIRKRDLNFVVTRAFAIIIRGAVTLKNHVLINKCIESTVVRVPAGVLRSTRTITLCTLHVVGSPICSQLLLIGQAATLRNTLPTCATKATTR